MKPYFLLIRKISPYSGSDILLGAFTDESAAIQARFDYLNRYPLSEYPRPSLLARVLAKLKSRTERLIPIPNGDPWQNQAFKDDGLKSEDLVILTLQTDGKPAFNELSIVSIYFDALGQITRKIDSVHPNRLLAENRMKQIESDAENADPESFPPNLFDTQTIKLNVIQSDKSEHQPRSG